MDLLLQVSKSFLLSITFRNIFGVSDVKFLIFDFFLLGSTPRQPQIFFGEDCRLLMLESQLGPEGNQVCDLVLICDSV